MRSLSIRVKKKRTRTIISEHLDEVRCHPLEYRCPSLVPSPPVQLRRGVPGAVLAIQEPAPIGRVSQQYPSPSSQGSAQVRHAGARTDHDVHTIAKCGSIRKVHQVAREISHLGARSKRLFIGLRTSFWSLKYSNCGGKCRNRSASGKLRLCSFLLVELPLQTNPTRGLRFSPSLLCQRASLSASLNRYLSLRGIVSTQVLKADGKFSNGQ